MLGLSDRFLGTRPCQKNASVGLVCLVGIGIRCPRPRRVFLGAPHVAIDVGALRGCYAKCKSHGEYAERTKVAAIGLERLFTEGICALRFGTVWAVAQENRFSAEGQVFASAGIDRACTTRAASTSANSMWRARASRVTIASCI